MFGALKGFWNVRSNRTISFLAMSAIVSGGVFYHFVEGWSWLDSFYFSVMTLTTVGYGDFSPETRLGKIFTMFYVVMGIGIIFGYIDALYIHRKKHVDKKARERARKIKRLKRKQVKVKKPGS